MLESPQESPPPLCLTCSKNVIRRARWPAKPGGVPVLHEQAACSVHSAAFPIAKTCPYYVREPGSD